MPVAATALATIDEAAMRARYERLVPRDYGCYSEHDRDYTEEYYVDVVEFYARAAATGLAVIFTVDQ